MRASTKRSLILDLHGEAALERAELLHDVRNTTYGLLARYMLRNDKEMVDYMNAPMLSTCNIALVYANEQLLRRNNIRARLASRGFVIRKEVQSDARSFSFRSVDLVVVIADNLGPGATKLVKQAAEHEKVAAGLLSEAEAYAKLAAACGKGRS